MRGTRAWRRSARRPRRLAERPRRALPTWRRSARPPRRSPNSLPKSRPGSPGAPGPMSARPTPSGRSGRSRKISRPRRETSRRPRRNSTRLRPPVMWPRSRPALATSARPARRVTTAIGPKSRSDPRMRAPVWDLPIRLFHWVLVALLGFSWWSAENHETELHIWSGIAILTLLLFRLLWGLFGSYTARFANFVRGPAVVRDYLRDNSSWRFAGHSPLGALSVIALLGAVAVQVGLGLISVDEDGLNEGPLAQLVSLDVSEAARDLHEDFFNILLALIAVHIAAIVIYRLLLGKKLTGAM